MLNEGNIPRDPNDTQRFHLRQNTRRFLLAVQLVVRHPFPLPEPFKTGRGGQVTDYRNDYRFNVSRLAKASYIVRVVTRDRQVHYLKLVKQ